MKCFWTRRGDAVGTAHTNRHGAVVDFRPVTSLPRLDVRIDSSTATLTLVPPKGVECVALVMQATRTRKILCDTVCTSRYMDTWTAMFEGVEFSATREVAEDKHTPEAEAIRAQAEATRRAEKAACERAERMVEERLHRATPAEFSSLSQPTRREWEKLQSAYWEFVLSELVIRARKALVADPKEVELSSSRPRIDKAWLITMQQGLLAIRTEERARRKAEFFGR